jgi:hypothetical protein
MSLIMLTWGRLLGLVALVDGDSVDPDGCDAVATRIRNQLLQSVKQIFRN